MGCWNDKVCVRACVLPFLAHYIFIRVKFVAFLLDLKDLSPEKFAYQFETKIQPF